MISGKSLLDTGVWLFPGVFPVNHLDALDVALQNFGWRLRFCVGEGHVNQISFGGDGFGSF